MLWCRAPGKQIRKCPCRLVYSPRAGHSGLVNSSPNLFSESQSHFSNCLLDPRGCLTETLACPSLNSGFLPQTPKLLRLQSLHLSVNDTTIHPVSQTRNVGVIHGVSLANHTYSSCSTSKMCLQCHDLRPNYLLSVKGLQYSSRAFLPPRGPSPVYVPRGS